MEQLGSTTRSGAKVMKQPDGLRSWLNEAETLGEIRHIEAPIGIWRLAGYRIFNERGSSPAVLFDAVKGYQGLSGSG
jgi:hypothetical protein